MKVLLIDRETDNNKKKNIKQLERSILNELQNLYYETGNERKYLKEAKTDLITKYEKLKKIKKLNFKIEKAINEITSGDSEFEEKLTIDQNRLNVMIDEKIRIITLKNK